MVNHAHFCFCCIPTCKYPVLRRKVVNFCNCNFCLFVILNFALLRRHKIRPFFPNFGTNCLKIWKKGLLCLPNRAKITCSTNYLFQKEVTYLKNLFYTNGYPIPFFNKILCQFQNKKTDSKTEKEFINLFIIPYLGKISKEFGLQIQSLIKKRFDTKITIVYKTTKVHEYFSLKSKTLHRTLL